MGSEMEPLLRAWSYFRRRKFQLCADLCTQMLEKSPYDQVPASPWQSVDPLAEAVGSGASLCPLGEAREETEVAYVVRKGTWSESFGVLDGGSLPFAFPGDPKFCGLIAPAINFNTPFPELVTFKGALLSF